MSAVVSGRRASSELHAICFSGSNAALQTASHRSATSGGHSRAHAHGPTRVVTSDRED